jgi:histidine triad (HIT) family protein
VKACIFCQIAAGTLEAAVVMQDETTLAFLDHRPLRPGHVLVVPRIHVPTLAELEPDQVGPLFRVVQRLATAVESAMHADGSFVAINIKISQSVPHLHVHVVPRSTGDGLFGKNFVWIRRPYPSQQAMRQTQVAISQAVERLTPG